MSPTPTHLRSLYRSLLRELPPRPLSTPSPIQRRIRTQLSPSSSSSSHLNASEAAPSPQQQYHQAHQYLLYIRAQRTYATLLERYNPGLGAEMDEEERVRLTARRVGMNLPVEHDSGDDGNAGGSGKRR